MSVFKVGQPVKITRAGSQPYMRAGSEGTILELNARGLSLAWCIARVLYGPIHAVDVPSAFGWYYIPHSWLVPLTPPSQEHEEAARQFIERIKRIEHEPMPLKEKA